jgi:tetratricopeptide (TPR) repeat protein
VLLTAGLLLIATAIGSAQTHNTAEYPRLIALYESGHGAQAVAELNGWTRQEVESAINASRSTLSDDQRIAAAMLHTELANVIVSENVSGAGFHVSMAGKLLETAGPQSARAALFARRWRYLVVSMYTSASLLGEAAYHLRLAEQEFPREPLLYVAGGALAERRAQFAVDLRRDRPLSNALRQRTEVQMQVAVNEYLKALAIDSHVALAHLHIGWIRLFLHDDDRARPELNAAIADARDDRTRYLAHLFLGALEEDGKQLRQAAHEYETVVALGPAFQSGYVALSRVEDALGDRARAEALALECAQLVKQSDDPWWDYRVQFDFQALADLRADVMHR